jgi:hypothetical protein
MDFANEAPVYPAVIASHPLARQFLPAESSPRPIVSTHYPANISALSVMARSWLNSITHLHSHARYFPTAVSWDGWEPISLLQLAMPLLVHTIIALVHWRSSGYWNRPTWSLLRNPPRQWRNLTDTPLWHLMASVLLCTQDLAVPGQSLWASTCIGLVETNHCRAAEVFS